MSGIEVHQTLLANGLQLLGEVNRNNKSAALGFFVKTGSRDEAQKESGVSHFLEHMMFKGTAKRNALELTFQMGNIGAQSNAFTSEENTVYYASIIPRRFAEMQEILCDMLRPALDQQEFDTEKKVILEEIALYQDRPQFYMFEKALGDFFGAHPAGNSVLGSAESISAVTRDEMADYFKRRYSPSNMVLTASGNFDWQRFVADAEKYCSKWEDFRTERKLARRTPGKVAKIYKRKNVKQTHVLMLADGCGAQDEERFAMTVLSTIIGDSSGSRLYWELIDSGLADGAGSDSDEKDGVGCFMAYASTEPEKLDRVAEILRRIVSTPLEFSEGDLERARTKLCARIVLSGELPLGRLMALGNEWNYNRRIHSLREVMERIKSVSRTDIENAVKRYPLRDWSEFRLVPE